MVVVDSAKYFLSCDWGTSSLRIYLVDRAVGKVIHSVNSPKGIKSVNDLCWKSAKKRSDIFKEVLAEQIKDLASKSEMDLLGIPLVASGMVTSSIGWIELPYASLPFPLSGKAAVSRFIPSAKDFPYDTVLISGVQSSAPDIMRGEECQMIGLMDQIDPMDGWYVFPGTHSKHIFLKNREITDFKTFMTGELYSLMANHSILSDTLKSDTSFDKAAFLKGVENGAATNLMHSLFKIRARSVQDGKKISTDMLSGLLIGHELNSLNQEGVVTLCAASAFKERYELALNFLRANAVNRVSDLQVMDQAVPYGHLKLLNNQIPK